MTRFLAGRAWRRLRVLRARFFEIPHHGDVTRLRALPRTTTLVAAGFPCQDLSQAGLLLGPVELVAQRDSAFGDYVRCMMTHTVEASRLAGDLVIAIGAWRRSVGLIGLGVSVVALAWLSGMAPRSQRR